MFKKRYLSLTFTLIFSGLMAMEQPEKAVQSPKQSKKQQLQPEKTVAIRGTDNKVIGIPEHIALKSSMIFNCCNDTQEEITHEGEKECSFDAEKTYVDFTQKFGKYAGIFGGIDTNENLSPLDLSAETLKMIFDCVSRKSEIKKLDKESLIRVFEAGHFLGVPHKIMRKLTLHAQNILSHDEQPELIQCNHYLNSIHSLYHTGALQVMRYPKTDDNGIECIDLIISDQKIDTLDGIELLAKDYENVCVVNLNLSKNRIKDFDVVKLLEYFPFLRKIFASENRIESLILPRELSYKFGLFLENNNIKDLSSFKAGEASHVDLTNNPLSTESKKIALRATLPTLLESQRHRVKALTYNYTLKCGLRGFGIGCLGFMIGSLPLVEAIHLLKTKCFHPEQYAYDILCKSLSGYDRYTMGGFILGSGFLLGGMGLYDAYQNRYNTALARHKFIPGQVKFDQEPKNT